MVQIVKTEMTGLCFIGDLHGDFASIKGMMRQTEFTDTAFVFCGDCGFGFNKPNYYPQELGKMKKIADEMNNECFFVRGNHDDPSWFRSNRLSMSRFMAVPDYTVIQTPAHNVLAIGGAISVDRSDRVIKQRMLVLEYMTRHKCHIETAKEKAMCIYWPDEVVVYDEQAISALKNEGLDIDIVATHTCPSFVDPLTKDGVAGWTKLDSSLISDLTDERETMTRIYRQLKDDGHSLRHWFYGHFHRHSETYFEDTKFVMLNMCRNGLLDVYDVR